MEKSDGFGRFWPVKIWKKRSYPSLCIQNRTCTPATLRDHLPCDHGFKRKTLRKNHLRRCSIASENMVSFGDTRTILVSQLEPREVPLHQVAIQKIEPATEFWAEARSEKEHDYTHHGGFLSHGGTPTHRIHVWHIYSNIGGILMVNVTIYTIHGSYGQ